MRAWPLVAINDAQNTRARGHFLSPGTLSFFYNTAFVISTSVVGFFPCAFSVLKFSIYTLYVLVLYIY